MARCRVTYLEVADERPGWSSATSAVVDLDAWQRTPAEHYYGPVPRQRPACPAWLAHLALVGLLVSGVALDQATIGPDEQAALDRARDRHRPGVVVDPADVADGEPLAP